MFKFMTHIPDKGELKKWLMRRGSEYRDQSRFHSAGLMTKEEFHEMLADLLGVETWDCHKVALFEREIGTLFKKVTCRVWLVINFCMKATLSHTFDYTGNKLACKLPIVNNL